jgi:ribonuclease HI
MDVIAFDGACKANGTPDCISCGAAVLFREDKIISTKSYVDVHSTNQRGELFGFISALRLISNDCVIITDSEYIRNTVEKDWLTNWQIKDWKTATGNNVANRDLWEDIIDIIQDVQHDFKVFHVKGHTLSLGAKTASNILVDKGIDKLYDAVSTKFIKPEVFIHAKEKFAEINEIEVQSDYVLRKYLDYNTVADYLAVEMLKGAL